MSSSSPWKKVLTVKSETMEEIMSEEFARHLQEREKKEELNEPGPSSSRDPDRAKPYPDDSSGAASEEIPEEVLRALQDTEDFDNDSLIAQVIVDRQDHD